MQDAFVVGRRQSGAQLARHFDRRIVGEPADTPQQRA